MKQNKTTTETQNANQSQGFYAQPRVFLTKDGEYLVHLLPGNMVVKKHVNFYKAILTVPFTPKARRAEAGEVAGAQVA